MISNRKTRIVTSEQKENINLRIIYQKIQNFLGRGENPCNSESSHTDMSTRGAASPSEDAFITPVSSVGDLIAMSPRQKNTSSEHPEVLDDLLTGSEFSSICDGDITMQEPPYDDNMFMDSTGIDYLLKCAESNRNNNLIDRGKESLFVKFDPLYAQNKSTHSGSTNAESIGDSTEGDVGYETGSAASVHIDSDTSATLKHSLSAGHAFLAHKEKPMQVVPPVMSAEIPKINVTHVRSTPVLVRSASAILTSGQVATDKLISISGETPPTAAPRSPRCVQGHSQYMDRLQSVRGILQRQDQEVLQLRQENRELRSSLQHTEHQYARSKEDMEAKLKKVTEERDNVLEREVKLYRQIHDKILSNKQMSIVMEEYEKTISSLIGEQQREKISSQELINKLVSERDQALNHLSNMESSFNDLLAKYEKCKSVILEAKDREKILEKQIAESEDGMKKYEELYNKLKQMTSDKLTNANETLDSVQKKHNVEIRKLNAIIKKHEITISSLQESLAQKTRDNEELTKICDQLLNEDR